MIEIQNVVKDFAHGKIVFRALDDVNIVIADGEFVAITGKSGSGKSTLLNIIGSLDSPTSGNIIIDGDDISSLGGKQIAAFRNKTVGFVFQSFYLEPSYTVYQNVELPLILAGGHGKQNRERVMKALKVVGLEEKVNDRARNLSGGEQQRVAIARAIVNDPAYILADEPCGNLDTANSDNIMRLLALLNKSGKTVIMVSHDMVDVNKAGRILTMSDGKIIKDELNSLKEAV